MKSVCSIGASNTRAVEDNELCNSREEDDLGEGTEGMNRDVHDFFELRLVCKTRITLFFLFMRFLFYFAQFLACIQYAYKNNKRL